jgi:nucleoid DNA-binding protein
MRVKVDWRSTSRVNYNKFKKEHALIDVTYDQWRQIIYAFNDKFKEHILCTGESIKLPYGFGEFSINKKIRKRQKGKNDEFINLPIDWQKTKEKGKVIYNFNHDTEGFFFGWHWFKKSARFKHTDLWYFKPSRATSRLLGHYIRIDKKYQHLYREWEK